MCMKSYFQGQVTSFFFRNFLKRKFAFEHLENCRKVAVKIIIRRNHVKLQLRHIKVKIVGSIIQQKIRKEIEFIQMELGEIILLLVMSRRLKEWSSWYQIMDIRDRREGFLRPVGYGSSRWGNNVWKSTRMPCWRLSAEFLGTNQFIALSLVLKHYFFIEKALDSWLQNASKLTALSVAGVETLINSKLRNSRNLVMDQSDFLAK